MFFNKRALALRLGLFFLFLFPLEAQEPYTAAPGETFFLSAGAGTLWVEDDGAAVYWRSGIGIKKGRSFFLDFDLSRVSSDLSRIDCSLFGLMGKIGVDGPWAGFTFASGIFNQPFISTDVGKVSLSSEGGQGSFFSLEVPLHFGSLTLVPSFLYGEADWREGDLYWFFGRPRIRSLWMYGLSAQLEPSAGHVSQGLVFYWVSPDLRIDSNEGEGLFNSGLGIGLLFYQAALEGVNTRFAGTLGWLYARAEVEGALTASNQHYALFPYLFYEAAGSFEIQVGFALLNFRYNHGIFRYDLSLGAIHAFYDQGEVETHYQKKKLFGGGEAIKKVSPGIKGIGAALLIFEAGIPSFTPGKTRSRLSLGLRKAFILPWGYEKLLSSGDDGSSEKSLPLWGTETLSLVKTALLSGLSLHGSLSW